MIEKLLLKLALRDIVSEEEEQALRDAILKVEEHEARQTVVKADLAIKKSNLLIAGLACRYKDMRDGRRQILELHVPGDFVDLHSFPLKRLDHNILALTPCTIGIVPHERLERITERMPHLSRLLWFSTMLDASIHREWIMSLGRRSAIARVAHLFCEMYVRFDVVNMTDDFTFPLPITQNDLAEIVGVTSVHVNRVLKDLREMGVVTFRAGKVSVHDFARVREIAEFDTGYLHLERRPH